MLATAKYKERRVRLNDEDAAVAFFTPAFLGMTRESLRVAHLDGGRNLLGVRLHYSNMCDEVDFPLRLIIRDALELDSAGLLIAHNHPSGDPAPSRNDLTVTRTLASLVQPLGIRLHDHIIFAGTRWASLRSLRLM